MMANRINSTGAEKDWSTMLVVNGEDYPEPATPEHDKLKSQTADNCNQHIGQFLEWCQEKGWELCAMDAFDEYLPLYKTIPTIIAEYLGIDQGAIEREKRELIAYLRVRAGGDPKEEREELGI